MNTLIRILATACYLATWSGLVQGAQYTIPVSLLYYTPGATSDYVFPRSGAAGAPLCTENIPYGKQYRVVGKSQGVHSYYMNMRVGQPAIVTLHEREGKGTARLKIRPLGVRKTATWGYTGGSISGDTCIENKYYSNYYAEKSINSNSTLELSAYLSGDPNFYYTLAFELLDPNDVTPGIYYARGGYQFKSSELAMSQGTSASPMVSPYLPNLSLVVGHVFKIDMPYTSVSLTQSYENDDIFTGKVRFRAQSNERYSITMTCSSSNAVTPEKNCNFAGTQMELATQARFPEQGRSFNLQHDTSIYIDGVEFTDSLYEYPGYIDFTLSGVSQHGDPGKTYFDTVNLTFEANF